MFDSQKNDDIKNPMARKKLGTVAGIVGIIVNIILAAAKLIAGIFAHSASITADAINNLSDAGASLITFISFKISSKPADKEHPFGHARMEYICSIVVSFLVLLVGFELLADSCAVLIGIKRHTEPNFSFLTVIILVFSIALTGSRKEKLITSKRNITEIFIILFFIAISPYSLIPEYAIVSTTFDCNKIKTTREGKQRQKKNDRIQPVQ